MKEYKLKINNNSYHVLIKEVTDEAVIAEVNDEEYVVEVETIRNMTLAASPAGEPVAEKKKLTSSPVAVKKASFSPSGDGVIPTPIPGQIISISVSKGDKVRQGQKLLTLEAMKLENIITATNDGTVEEILVAEGEVVNQGQTLLRVV